MKRFICLGAVVSAGVYGGLAAVRGTPGFPLDDAWIHQVYARNLGTRFEFAFFAGQPSAGSTAPLWTMLLAIGYVLHLDFRGWTYLLGIALLTASAFLVSRFPFQSSVLRPPSSVIRLWPFLLLFEWHLVWSAVSGMEIPLFIFFSLVLWERFYARAPAWRLGLIAGLLTLTRPEGVVMAALVGVGLLLDADQQGQTSSDFPRRWLALIGVPSRLAVGLVSIILPYLLFNFAASGTLLPNTFYAKAAEYAILLERTPLIVRWLELLGTPFVGAQVLLIPGLVYLVVGLVRHREWRMLLPLGWVAVLPALYAWRLPVTYQHGRYEMPVIPFILVYGGWGTAILFERIKSWMIRTVWGISIAVTLVSFWVLGAMQYATDVAIIDCEMVQTARWVVAHAPPGAVIAAHDIGALGYYYAHPFIDLAGLVSPEVIPFIRDHDRLRDYLLARNATLVIVFPGWYPHFDADPRFVPVFQTDCAVTRAAGEKNMIIYRIIH